MSINLTVAFHRKLGCDDESSTDEEQAERILFYYPENTPISAQLARVGLIQSLMDFADKFSNDPIDVVVLDKLTYGFVECEKDFWIVVACNNTPERDDSGAIFYSHTPNGTGVTDAIVRMYRTYMTFFGEVNNQLASKNGWDGIAAVQQSRKIVRKLRLKLRQQLQDLDYLRSRELERSELEDDAARAEFDQGGLHIDSKSLSDIEEEVSVTNREIASELLNLEQLSHEDRYSPVRLQILIGSFLQWYICTGELQSLSALHGMTGMHFSPVGHPAFQTLMRVRQGIEDVCNGISRGILAIHDGQVIWSDLDDLTTFMVYDYLRIQEYHSIRTDVVQLGAAPEMDAASALAAAVSVLGMDKDHRTSASNSIPEHWSSHWLSRKGFITAKNNSGESCLGVVDYETLMYTLQRAQDSVADEDFGSDRNNDTSAQEDNARRLHHQFVLSNVSGPCSLWCPRIYSCEPVRPETSNKRGKGRRQQRGNAALGGVELGLGLGQSVCIGRAVIYRHNRFILVIVLPDWDDSDGFHFVSPSQATSTPLGVAPDDSFTPEGMEGEASPDISRDPMLDHSNHVVSESNIPGQALLLLCTSLQAQIKPELDKLQRAVAKSATHNRTPVASSHPAPGTTQGGAMAGPNALALAGLGSTPGNMSSAKRPTMPPGVRLLYFNVCNRAIKAVDVYRTRVDPLLLWPSLLRPSQASMLPILNVQSSRQSTTQRLSTLEPSEVSRSPMTEFDDEFRELQERDFQPMFLSFPNHILAELRPRFPLSPSLLAGSLEPGVVRAINDLREALSGKQSREPGSGVSEACLRVSSMPHGGVWVVARRLGERIVFFIVEGCGTLNEMQQQVQLTMETMLGMIMI